MNEQLRSNGLGDEAPDPGQLVLVAGGGGYIGTTLVPRLLRRGYRVRVLDLFWWDKKVLLDAAGPAGDLIQTIHADVRAIPAEAFDGVDAVINLSGLSNDPTAEYDPDANWQMNAVATETMGRACLDRGIERFVFASSCSLYDGLPLGMHDETAAIEPRAAYAVSKHYGEQALKSMAEEGLCPVILRNGTVYGYSPRMRFDLVVNTFAKDALLKGKLSLHGGGWMWRPLVDVQDASDALICAMEAPAELVKGEVFNVLHSNYQIRELALLVAGSVQMMGRPVDLEEVGAPDLTRNYECSNMKLAQTLGFIPSRSVVTALDELLEWLAGVDPAEMAHPRFYNLPWLELRKELDQSFSL
jgi:nucleoside-diphosphate-sugar epimerase